MDRNRLGELADQGLFVVALRKESVDRNTTVLAVLSMYSVALRKESVDRNCRFAVDPTRRAQSLSARRAWIEIKKVLTSMYMYGSRSPQGERG